MSKKQTSVALVMMLILLALMTLCLCWMKGELHRVEAEIYAAEERAMERESHLLAAQVPDDQLYVLPEVSEPLDQPEAPLFDESLVKQIITAEGGTDQDVCNGVTQALFNACELHGWELTPDQMAVEYRYAEPADWISNEAAKAYDEIFCSGVTYEGFRMATLFYAPAYCESPWHESQRFVIEVGGVRFFEEVHNG